MASPAAHPKDLLARAVVEAKSGSESAKYETKESSAVFIGSKGAGKSTFVNKFLRKNDTPKPTPALDYAYGRQVAKTRFGKDVSHIWEIGGGLQLISLLESCITAETVRNTVVVITADLSRPWAVCSDVRKAVDALRGHVTALAKESKVQSLQAKLENRERAKYDRANCPDKNLPVVGLPILILGTKYDAFVQFDSERRKMLSRALRYIAHTSGAGLCFSTSEAVTGTPSLPVALQTLQSMVFKTPLPRTENTDHAYPIIIHAGNDSYSSIGSLKTKNMGAKDPIYGMPGQDSQFAQWEAAVSQLFRVPESGDPAIEDELESSVSESAEFLEPSIDIARGSKMEELQAYRKELEKQRRNEKRTRIARGES